MHLEPTPVYDEDNLRVWLKNVDFLQDPTFLKAYNAGISSGHRFEEVYGRVSPRWRAYICCCMGWYATQLPGDFVECGVNTGIFSLAVANYIDFNKTGKSFFLFDTFKGIPDEQMTESERKRGTARLYRDNLELARHNFAPFPNAKLVVGKIPDTLGSVEIDRVCYLSIDMNVAVPEVAALNYFWDRLVPGAPVILDDYAWSGYEEQKKAHDEFAASKGLRVLNLPTGQGLLLKPYSD
jgi:O-methyltransferase